MNAYEFNKFAGATLMALLVTTVIGFIGNALVHPVKLEKPVVVIEGVQEQPEANAAAAAPAQVEPVSPVLAKANPDAGKAIFKQCATCHTDEKGGPNRIGPNQWNVVGRPKASQPGFQYSDAMKKYAAASAAAGDPNWTYEDINKFIANPRAAVPGTKMTFVGLKKLDDRANVIAYLRTQADSPQPLPQ
ncbi:MAG TPA: cytochrome c family protein [Alphaproteobacteria bacterium]